MQAEPNLCPGWVLLLTRISPRATNMAKAIMPLPRCTSLRNRMRMRDRTPVNFAKNLRWYGSLTAGPYGGSARPAGQSFGRGRLIGRKSKDYVCG